MRVTYPQWTNYESNGIIAGGVRQGKGKGWHYPYAHQHYSYNNGYPSYHTHNQSK